MKYKEELNNMILNGETIISIANKIGLSQTGTRYWLKKYGFKTNGHYRFKKWNKEDLEKYIKQSRTKADVLKLLGVLLRPGNYRTFDRYVKMYNLDTSHFNRYFHKNRFNNNKYTNEDIFKENSVYKNSKQIKQKLVKLNYKDYKCEQCDNIGVWNNKKIELQLDHINGINNDNRVENLRFLCPNCHSQTDTFCSKNGKVVNMVITSD